MTYEVRTEAFAGPLDLLVKLVVSQEVDIWEVSLSRLVDDFVAVMAAVEFPEATDGAPSGETAGVPVRGGRIDIEAASEFALLAATLIELKSRRLLPAPPVELDIDEELAAYGIRDAALARLLEGRTFGRAARLLRERWDAAALGWPRCAGPEERFIASAPDLLEGATRGDLTAALERVLAPKPVPRVDVSHLRAAGITVDEALCQIAERLADTGSLTFRELTSHLSERIVIVVYFLALLEMFGSGLIELEQAERFGDIGVEWVGGDDATLPAIAGGYSEDAA
ncbi:segregation and condensation protein A [Candidatus Poriferisodalis sp.]|uniref:segregation and condensation protein A n=1 Tax=Candidatus Poriferisodalis sp. TaxID=3101277 RepID=UPI003B013879